MAWLAGQCHEAAPCVFGPCRERRQDAVAPHDVSRGTDPGASREGQTSAERLLSQIAALPYDRMLFCGLLCAEKIINNQ
jgi:hypothetical protein